MIKYLSIVLLFLIISCNKAEVDNYKVHLKSNDSLVANIPTNIPVPDFMNKWSYNDKTFLFSVPGKDYSTYYSYHIDSETWSSQKFYYYDNNGIRSDAYIYVNDTTKIFIPLQAQSEILIFKKDTLNRNINLDDVNELLETKDFNPLFNDYSNIHLSNGKLYFPVRIFLKLNPSNFNQDKLYAVYNLKTDEIKYVGSIPQDFEDYASFISNNFHKSIAVGQNNVLVSLPKLPYLLVYDKNGDFVTKLDAQNDNINKSQTNDSQEKNKVSILNHLSGLYNRVLYDKFRNIYYRISTSYDNYDGSLSGLQTKNFFKNKKTRIHVFDEKLKTISVNEFRGLNENKFFINAEGLFIQSGYERENELVFRKFTLQKK